MPNMSWMPDKIYEDEPEYDYAEMARMIIPDPTNASMDAMKLDRQAGWFMKAPKYTPPSWSKDVIGSPYVTRAARGITSAIALDKASELKNYIENKASDIMSQIANPESLINEAVNRHLSKNPKARNQ